MQPSNRPPSSANSNAQRLCRNITIYGFCKYENKGCEFNHQLPSAQQPVSSPSRNKTPLFSANNNSPSALNAPTFVPSSSTSTNLFGQYSQISQGQERSLSVPLTPMRNTTSYQQNYPHTPQESYYNNPYTNYESNEMYSSFGNEYDPQIPTAVFENLSLKISEQVSVDESPFYHAENDRSEYFLPSVPSQQQPTTVNNVPQLPIQYHLYVNPRVSVGNLHPNQRIIHDFFISDQLREELQKRAEATIKMLDSKLILSEELPFEVHTFHSLYPIQSRREKSLSSYFGHLTCNYRAVNGANGRVYVLKRVKNYRLSADQSIDSVAQWQKIAGAGIVHLSEAFTTKQFNDYSLIFVYEFHPLAVSIEEKHFGQVVQEKVLWSYLFQLISVIRIVHGAGLACHVIHHSKVLVTGEHRLRVSGLGMYDVLKGDESKSVYEHQQEDFFNLGILLLSLATGQAVAVTKLSQSLKTVGRQCSDTFMIVIGYLIDTTAESPRTVEQVLKLCGSFLLDELNHSLCAQDMLEGELSKELENGRLFRLMCKLLHIIDRPEFGSDPSWAETGDRLMLKHFRDYVFHQVDTEGKPVISISHVLSCLNKLDVGSSDRIMLMSRDEQTCIIVTYADLKLCIDQAFQDLWKKSIRV